MLEIKNLTKIYKNKVGTDVKALDDVSLKFPETGMVFLLGKSGSGKSTLLNVIGGLDNPTTGEIIVKGRSSKDFTQSDFDSYRNTFVGFIFQEYNILNEFTVFDNIALAIELQDKQPDKKMVEDLLERVDLSGYGKRKPNTLSGGQKQRIAIARALIKNPEIIMADEPTGALDSNTGKQVLDTLKKLSEDTLVIVVSHDREFAENYGDRIIELKDGKVISDISKTVEESNELSKNVSIIGDTLSIKSGSDLTDSDFISIKEFIKNTSNDVVLSKNDKDIEALKRSAKINDNGEQEVFKDTKHELIELKEYSSEESKFIKSKLPMKHAFKIGISSMKNKPFRLFMTVVLVSVAFMLFGLLSTMMFYDSESTFKDTLAKSSYKYLKLEKEFKMTETSYFNGEEEGSFNNYGAASFTEAEYNDLKNKYGKDTFYGVSINSSYSAQKFNNAYYHTEVSVLAYMDSDNSLYSSITGTYPKNDDELLISSYIADTIIYTKAYDADGNVINVDSRDKLIGQTIKIADNKFKIVGYYDSGVVDSVYDSLKDDNNDAMLVDKYYGYIRDELHLVAFVSKEKIRKIAEDPAFDQYYSSSISDYSYMGIYVKGGYPEEMEDFGGFVYSELTDNDKVIWLNGGNTLNDGEVVVSMRAYADMVNRYLTNKVQNHYDEEMHKTMELASNIMNNGRFVGNELVKFSYDELKSEFYKLYAKTKNINLEIEYKLFNSNDGHLFGDKYSAIVVGIYTGKTPSNTYQPLIYFNNKDFNKLWDLHKVRVDYYSVSSTKYVDLDLPYRTVYVPFNNNADAINGYWDIYNINKYDEFDTKTIMTSYIVENMMMIDEMVDILYKVFLYGGLVLCLFAILLFSNFISVSITNKTREIGILRAVGARSVDVFKIFFSESFFITCLCLVISTTGTIVICNIINQILDYGVGISVFVFGILSLIIMLMIGVVTAILATYLPVKRAARRKPVESIRAI